MMVVLLFRLTNRIIRMVFVALVILAGMQACKSEPQSASIESSHLSVVDFSGQEIVLDQPAERIIALAPHIVENVYSAGAGDFLVARVRYADFPPEVMTLPLVGGHHSYNLEAITKLKPDLILAWKTGVSEQFIHQIKRLGVPIYFDEPSKLEQVAKSIRDIGILTGREEAAEKTISDYQNKLSVLKDKHSDLAIVDVFYQVWDDPLYTINGKQIISDVLRLCGGYNIFSEAPIKAPIVTLESIISRNPEVIMTGNGKHNSQTVLEKWGKWQNLLAVKSNNLFEVDPDIVTRHTVRLLQGAEVVCDKLQIARDRRNLSIYSD